MNQNRKPKKRGLGSDTIDEETKRRIHSMGGKASHGGGKKSAKEGKTDVPIKKKKLPED